MANLRAWQDRQLLMDYYSGVKTKMETIIEMSNDIQLLKAEIQADSGRLAQFTQLMLEDPSMTLAQVLQKIANIKTLADYLIANPI